MRFSHGINYMNLNYLSINRKILFIFLNISLFLIIGDSYVLSSRIFDMNHFYNTPKNNNIYMFGNLKKVLKFGLTSLSINSFTSVKKSYGKSSALLKSSMKPTNDIIKEVNNIRFKRLGGSDIIVSEIGLGTQRWYNIDLNYNFHL